ncbi:MAG: ATP-binding protein, partial [candidate division NC10 bacterium]|nr:ATP-binding protein [candidate division NC10 bacterium]
MSTRPSPTVSRKLWEDALSVIQGRLPYQTFETWFSPLVLESQEVDHRLHLLVPNQFFKDWFEEHYLGLLRSVLAELASAEIEVLLLVQERVAPPEGAKADVATRRPARRERDPGTAINPKYTFDTFVVGSSNQFAHAGALAVAEQPARAYNPLFIYGGVGLGKTHLLHAIGNRALEKHHAIRVSYVSSEKFTNDLINAIRFDSNVEFRNRYRTLDLLLIDDIQFIAGKERTQEEFF